MTTIVVGAGMYLITGNAWVAVFGMFMMLVIEDCRGGENGM